MADEEHHAQRRLVAILVADVAGSSKLMEADEFRAVAELRRVLDDVLMSRAGQLGGRPFKKVGDGVLIEFASPVAATRCALAVQEHLAAAANPVSRSEGVRLRIGINLGDVIVDDDGDLRGDGVNVAARLEALAPVGGIAISAKVRDELHGRLAIDLIDRGDQQLKGISRPVRVFVWAPSSQPVASPYVVQRLAPDEVPSIAVMPFTNLSVDPEQEYLADGLVEDIITALSCVPRLFVIARNSTFIYKGTAIDARQVGRELGVRYILIGSVRRSGPRIRISAQLVETLTGMDVWAERWDADFGDIFDLQDQIGANVAGALVPHLEAEELRRTRQQRPASLTSYDLYLRALFAAREMTRNSNAEAVAAVEKILSSDPGYARAAALGAWCYTLQVSQYWATREEVATPASRMARIALKSGANDSEALAMGGYAIAFVEDDMHRGKRAIERSLCINPNGSTAFADLGWVECYLGHSEAALAAFAQAARLSPRDPTAFRGHAGSAFAHLLGGNLDAAIAAGRLAVELNEDFLAGYRALAAALAHKGQLSEAKSVIEALRRHAPSLTLSSFHATSPFRHSGRLSYLVEGLRVAGLPD